MHALCRIHGFDYSCAILPVTFHFEKSAGHVTMLSTVGMTGGGEVLKNSVKVLLVDRRHYIGATRQLHIGNSVGSI